MQDFTVAFSRVSRAALAANPELKNRIADLLGRAYYNLHGQPITQADPQWVATLSASALQLSLDARVEGLNVRGLIQLFETVIRVSEEHLLEARRHAAMSCNVFYLKETSLDAALAESSAPARPHATSTVISTALSHSGRLRKADADA